MKQNTYKTAGVDISKADEFVDGIKNFLSSIPLLQKLKVFLLQQPYQSFLASQSPANP